jgi:hypothetical protein
MGRAARSKSRTCLAFLLPLLALLAACSGLQVKFSLPFVAPARPQVLLFKAMPSKLEQGTATRLNWVVTGADSVTIDHGIGVVEGSGYREIKPSGVTAYNLTAVNSGGTVVSSVIINVVPPAAPAVVQPASLPPTPVPTSTITPSNINIGLLPALKENEGYVFYKGAVMVGACGQYVVLRNNPNAKNPTWAELKDFLKADQTDRLAYITGKFTCGDFAQMLHNNAEAAGIRAALVAVELRPAGMADGVIYHSLDAFETTDRGMVYIDDTSSSQGYFADKQVNLVEGDDYVPVALVAQPGQMQTWPSMGSIVAIDVFQW